MWPDSRLLELLDIEVPIIQAPMAGSDGPALAAAVSGAGGLGSVGAAVIPPDRLIETASTIRSQTNRPFNLNFFCHKDPNADAGRSSRWIERLRAYYSEFGIETPDQLTTVLRPFDGAICDAVVEIAPPVVSFHFGLPDDASVRRLKDAGCRILSSATTPAEAMLLESRGVDAVIAQGWEAGGHRGVFAEDWRGGSGQIGTLALVPQVVDAVKVPVIGAGGIADGRGIAACFALGAAGVQIGTAYLQTDEAITSPLHRAALAAAGADQTAVTNVVSGRPARAVVNRMIRELGPIDQEAPDFPLPFAGYMPLAQGAGSGDFIAAWAGQGVALGRAAAAGDLTRDLADSALRRIRRIAAAP